MDQDYLNESWDGGQAKQAAGDPEPLNEHHSGIEDKANQTLIDVLTVVLSEEMFSFSFFFFLPKHTIEGFLLVAWLLPT